MNNPANENNYGIPNTNPYAENSDGYLEEIYAMGFRNPWRSSFDFETNSFWVGDVGNSAWEEYRKRFYRQNIWNIQLQIW